MFSSLFNFFGSLFRPTTEPDTNNLDPMGSDGVNSSVTQLSQSEVDDLGVLNFLTDDLVADNSVVTAVQDKAGSSAWSEFDFDAPALDALSSFAQEQPTADGIFDDLDELDQTLAQKSFDEPVMDLGQPADGFGVVQLTDQLTWADFGDGLSLGMSNADFDAMIAADLAMIEAGTFPESDVTSMDDGGNYAFIIEGDLWA